MIIYIDSEYKCHLEDDGTMTSYETDFFEGKCDTYIEGYRLVPEGETWTRDDGEEFSGLMISPWRNSEILDAAQQEYERNLEAMSDMQAALEVLEVEAE